ncbi:hypothetical protein [Corynebacterium pilosum]
MNSEKYELRPRDYEAALANGDSLQPYITQLNQIRRDNPALQQLRNIHFHQIDNPNLIACSKVDAVTGNAVLVIVNLDSYGMQEGMIDVDMEAIGLRQGDSFLVHDAVSGAEYAWSDRNFVRLEPLKDVAHIFVLPDVLPERREKLAWREIPEHDYRP